MKVLYLASNAVGAESLQLEREIMALQARAEQVSVAPPLFVFLPSISMEEVPREIARHRPDVLHIAAHGAHEGLWFATQDNRWVEISASNLVEMLPHDHTPKLVVLNACNSDETAALLAKRPLVAIGTTAPVTNRAAVASASVLYDRLLSGASIGKAYAAMNAVVETYDEGRVSLSLKLGAAGLDERSLHTPVRLVAKLNQVAAQKVKAYIGIIGAPADIHQAVFFTDDPTFDDEDLSDEDAFTEVVRDVPRHGEIWTVDPWDVDGDCRIGAAAITAANSSFCVSGLLSEALEAYVELVPAPKAYRDAVVQAIAFLRRDHADPLAHWRGD